MNEKKLTINITKLEDSGCIAYKAIIVEFHSTVLAESLEDLFEAISFTIESCEQDVKTPVQV